MLQVLVNIDFVILQLWEIKFAKSSMKDKNVATVEFLSTLNRHSRTVNVVRFSPNGKFNTLDFLLLQWK